MKCALLFEDSFWQQQEHGGVIGGTCWIGPSDVNQIYLPNIGTENGGYLMLYLRGEAMKRWLEHPLVQRKCKALDAIEQLFPFVKGQLKKHLKDFIEVVWDEAGSGAYFLTDAEKVRDTLQPIDRIVFSPVPRGWIDDALKDGQMTINQIKKIFRE